MSQLPGAASAAIEDAKVTDYLLNPAHPEGAPKAKFFERFGYTQSNSGDLKRALLDHPMSNQVVRQTSSKFGEKFTVRCSLTTPDGRNPCIVSVWTIEPPGTTPRFVTAYPEDQPD